MLEVFVFSKRCHSNQTQICVEEISNSFPAASIPKEVVCPDTHVQWLCSPSSSCPICDLSILYSVVKTVAALSNF